MQLNFVPGIGTQCIVGTEDRIDFSTAIPEVEIQPVPTGVVVHLKGIAPVGVARDGELCASSHVAADADVEAREGLGLSRGQSRVDVGVLPAGIGQRERIRAAVDDGAFNGPAPGAIAAR